MGSFQWFFISYHMLITIFSIIFLLCTPWHIYLFHTTTDQSVCCCDMWFSWLLCLVTHVNRQEGGGETFGSWSCEKIAWICWRSQWKLGYLQHGYLSLPLHLPLTVWIKVRLLLFFWTFDNFIITASLMMRPQKSHYTLQIFLIPWKTRERTQLQSSSATCFSST